MENGQERTRMDSVELKEVCYICQLCSVGMDEETITEIFGICNVLRMLEDWATNKTKPEHRGRVIHDT